MTAIRSTYFTLETKSCYKMRLVRPKEDLEEASDLVLQACFSVIPFLILLDGLKHLKVKKLSLKTKSSIPVDFYDSEEGEERTEKVE